MGEAVGARGGSPHPAPSTYWLSSLAACKEREMGHGPPTLEAPPRGSAPRWVGRRKG